ncbi:MAG: alpha-glucosidase/alpha-galactosidase [Planctomycetota bacterium]
MPNITFIGAGSVVFAQTLMCDILQRAELADSTITLMDIDPKRLKVAEIVARKTVAQLKVPARVVATMDRRKAIKGAKYVINMVQVGGYPSTLVDFNIPKKYGHFQTIGDTLGIGGIFRALRTIPVVTGIARDIADVGDPEALFLNYTNPMAMLCMAIDKAVGVPHVGLCHSVQGTSQMLARFIGLPYDQITFRCAGINHMAFFTEFRYKHQDVYPLLFKAMEDPDIYNREKVRFEMMRRLGYFVTESSEHQSEYSPYFIHHGKGCIEQFDIPIDEYLRRCESILATWAKTEKEMVSGDKQVAIRPISHEYGSEIIAARETGKRALVYGNVPNTGLITNLPAGCCVEVPTNVDRLGLHPEYIGALPPQLAAFIRTNVNVQELTVAAALEGRRDHVYHAAMLDPHLSATLPLDKIWAMVDELIDAHGNMLPKLSATVPGTGRALGSLKAPAMARIDGPVTPFAPDDPAANRFRVELENGTDRAIKAVLRVRADKPGVECRPSRLTIQAAAGKNGSAAFEVHRSSPDLTRFDLELEAESGEVICLGLKVVERRQVPVPAAALNGKSRVDGSGKAFARAATFEVTSDGDICTHGRLAVSNGDLLMRLEVADTDVVLARQPWQASCVEVFLAEASGSQTRIRKLFLQPGKGKQAAQVLDLDLKPVAGAKITQTPAKLGYALEVSLPVRKLGLKGKEILAEFRPFLNAFGSAHGQRYASAFGSLNPNGSTLGYAVLTLA